MTALILQPDLGIEHVADLHAQLLPHLDDGDALSLVGDQVRRVHTAGLQLLHAFVRDRAEHGLATSVVDASSVLADGARQLALAVSLGVDAECAA